MLTTISVTQEHIDSGKRRICNKCPVALAINECLQDDCLSFVEDAHISFYKGNSLKRTVLSPWNVQSFIVAFDSSQFVVPFMFTLDIPDELFRNETNEVCPS